MNLAGAANFTVDDINGIVRVSGNGLWTPDIVDTHFKALEAELKAIRKAGRKVRVLVDMRDGIAQSAELVERLSEWTGRIYFDNDRVSVVASSALLAMQIRRASRVKLLGFFSDCAEALRWLLSDAPAREWTSPTC